jgi:hypothetical protein
MTDLFDHAASRQAKADGMELAATNRAERLAYARQVALEVTPIGGVCTADTVYQAVLDRGISPDLGNAAGSLFRGAHWQFTGRWEPSRRISNHARANRIWERIL